MKKTFLFNLSLLCAMMASVMFTSCADRMEEVKPGNGEDQVPEEVVARLQKLGFNTEGVKLKDPGYLVEGDIMITPEALAEMEGPVSIPGIANEEQYRVYNLVTGTPRVIRISGVSLNSTLSTALDWAIANYNALNLTLSFQRVSSNADITVAGIGSVTAVYSGFPSGGDPYPAISIGGGLSAYGTNVCEHILTHEIGHCIGMYHTDPFSTACSSGNPGTGVVHIPGTPQSDPNSIFNTCYPKSTTGEFSYYDKIALQYLY